MAKQGVFAERLPSTSAQDGHLQRMRIPEATYMYN